MPKQVLQQRVAGAARLVLDAGVIRVKRAKKCGEVIEHIEITSAMSELLARLRAYYVTRHKAERGALPDLHANPATTARVYDRTKIVRRRGM
ncbi:hypothetical protein [Burkholderia ubonensis]|uniref:hypothetical protein n=1 Tax=Burkholderia ubonensis TaxID=101571 RepID=UPI002116E1E1|nr:hypothetical protein [Burkholderia ubonensis]